MKQKMLLTAIFFALLISCKKEYTDLPNGMFAVIETNKGTIITSLEFKKAPVTVANFVTLAEGKNPFVAEYLKDKPFYNGLLFHRVIKDFMIQGGDPDGNGSGGPGYKFKDEITDLKHTPGALSMANAGPGTNGSQFFITHVATEHLDGLHTVFGYVIQDGMKVVNEINLGDAILSISIVRNGEAAKKFDAVKIFTDYVANDQEDQKERMAAEAEDRKINEEKYQLIQAEKMAYFAEIKAGANKKSSGLRYKIITKGTGNKPKSGTTVYIEYAGYLENGKMFDTSIPAIAKEFGTYDEVRAMQKGYSAIQFQAGDKDGLIPGFIEGIEQMSIGDKAIIFIPAHLGYGPQGARDVIPPNANLIFEMELSDTPQQKMMEK